MSATALDPPGPDAASSGPQRSRWAAVSSLSLGVFALVTAEVLPASLLTPLAVGLNISEGVAGQTVTATAVMALTTSLFISTVIGGVDRRRVMIGLSFLLVLANLIAAAAPGLPALLVGRTLTGIAAGGFWSLSVAILTRLVRERDVPKGLSIMFMGASVATIIAIPAGSYLGALVGWRGAFMAATGLALSALVLQLATLPTLPAQGRAPARILFHVLRRPGVAIGMTAALLVFGGHFTFFTYLRPFLETVTGVGVDGVTLILLAFGLTNLCGTYLIAFLIRWSLRAALLSLPGVMAAIATALATIGGVPAFDALLISLWGLAIAGVPVAWSTWVTRSVPDQAETGGSLIVAVVNLSMAAGAVLGGSLLELSGPRGVFLASGVVLALAAVIIIRRVRVQ